MDGNRGDKRMAAARPEVDLFGYLESRGHLSELKAAGERHTTAPPQSGALFPFELSLDAVDLLEVDGNLQSSDEVWMDSAAEHWPTVGDHQDRVCTTMSRVRDKMRRRSVDEMCAVWSVLRV